MLASESLMVIGYVLLLKESIFYDFFGDYERMEERGAFF
jgi:hypothetical protein